MRELSFLLFVAMASSPGAAWAQDEVQGGNATFSLGVNAVQLTLVGASSAGMGSPFTPIPIESHLSLSRNWGLTGTVLVRHEHENRMDFDGVSFAVGPRFTFLGDGLEGWYLAFKLGLGYGGGTDFEGYDYARLELIIQPEIGYSIVWGPPGLFLVLGLGLQGAVYVHEADFPMGFSAIGNLMHHYQPLFNGTIGFAI